MNKGPRKDAVAVDLVGACKSTKVKQIVAGRTKCKRALCQQVRQGGSRASATESTFTDGQWEEKKLSKQRVHSQQQVQNTQHERKQARKRWDQFDDPKPSGPELITKRPGKSDLNMHTVFARLVHGSAPGLTSLELLSMRKARRDFERWPRGRSSPGRWWGEGDTELVSLLGWLIYFGWCHVCYVTGLHQLEKGTSMGCSISPILFKLAFKIILFSERKMVWGVRSH